MLRYRVAAAGVPSAAKHMANYYSEVDVPELAEALAKYYTAGATAAIPQRDMNPELAALLGIDQARALQREELANVLNGQRADGEEIAGRAKQVKLAYVDFVFSAPKSASIAIVLAETNAERAIIDDCQRIAVDKTMHIILDELGWMRRGDAGRLGADKGHMTYFTVDHFAARPTAKIAVRDGDIEDTVLVTVGALGADMQRHTHCLTPTVILTDDGNVGSPDFNRLKESVHEWGRIYQAVFATECREAGIRADLDAETGMAYLPDVPRWICKAFSKRTWESDDAAKEYAATLGVDWDALSPHAKATMLHGQASRNRRSKEDSDLKNWHKQAADLRYEHKRMLYPERGHGIPENGPRIEVATDAALPMLADQFVYDAKLNGSVPRVMAAAGLIASGTKDPLKDIARVTAAMRDRGVIHEGRRTDILWSRERGQRWASVTTKLHADQEDEAIWRLQEAAADRSSDLSSTAIQRAVDAFLVRNPHISFETEHGKSQREMIERLATSGRAALGIGAAGAGKTTLIAPLVDAWHEEGRRTIGVTLAWRQTRDLAQAGVGGGKKRRSKRLEPDTNELEKAGIDKDSAFALARFLRMAASGKLELDRNTVVIVDEAATIGTRQLLQLVRLRAEHDFQIVGLADPQQIGAIEHGNTVRLFRKALGEAQVPEIATTVRQEGERDRETAALFREGNAEAALDRKAEDGTLLIVPGNAADAIRAAVDLLEARQRENAGDPAYRIGISVPTNDDVLAVGREIRARRKIAGEIVGPEITLPAEDGRGTHEYQIALARGDRVRLFRRVHVAEFGGGVFGDNGTVAEIVAMNEKGMTLRRCDTGKEGLVKWDSLRDEKTQRMRLSYGDALTINTRQGDDMPEHITLMPHGSQVINGFAAYSADTRHRKRSWIVTSHGAEKQEVVGRRALGDPRPVEPAHIRANIARNLSRQPEKVLATDFLEQAERDRREGVRRQQEADFRAETNPEPPVFDPSVPPHEEPREPKRLTGPRKPPRAEIEDVRRKSVAAMNAYHAAKEARRMVAAARMVLNGDLPFSLAQERLISATYGDTVRGTLIDPVHGGRWLPPGVETIDAIEARIKRRFIRVVDKLEAGETVPMQTTQAQRDAARQHARPDVTVDTAHAATQRQSHSRLGSGPTL